MPGKDIPMIMWGTYRDKKEHPHIVPVIERYAMPGHILSEKCFCGPKLDVRPNTVIYIHNIVH
jgi:hypothetical protein